MPAHLWKLFLAFRCLMAIISCADIGTHWLLLSLRTYNLYGWIRKWWCWWTVEIIFQCSRWRFLYSNFMDSMEVWNTDARSVKWPCERVKLILYCIQKFLLEKWARHQSINIDWIRMNYEYAQRDDAALRRLNPFYVAPTHGSDENLFY